MKTLIIENQFRKDLKSIRKRGVDLSKLETLIPLLQNDEPIPPRHRPHKLAGEWKGVWECHVLPDLLLIYDFDAETLSLIRLGSHADLF